MHLRPLVASGALLGASLIVTGFASPALAACDSYSAVCPTDAPTTPPSDDKDAADQADDNRALPFTGGELILMTGIGAGALAGGTALVLAGRRKSSPSL